MQISVKDVEETVFREVRAESVRGGFKVGRALSLAMKLWLEKKERRPKMSLLDLKPTDWGKGTERLSEEIDKVLY